MKYILQAGCHQMEIFAEGFAHSNKMKFKGVLVLLGEASTKAPNGSSGHKILIPIDVAKKRLHTLKGMGLNYADSLDRHAPTRKVGVIQKAWIEGNKLWVSGTIWKKDFPDAEKDLKKSGLGMSFEASDITVEDQHADVWKLTDLCFTGATILYKASAAYHKTEALAASASSTAKLLKMSHGEKPMAKSTSTKKTKKIAAEADSSNTLVKVLNKLASGIKTLTESTATQTAETRKGFKKLNSSLVELHASMSASSDEEEEISAAASSADEADVSAAESSMEEPDMPMKAKKKKVAAKGMKAKKKAAPASSSSSSSSEDDDDMESEAADDEDELADMASSEEEADDQDEPGKVNDEVENDGSKTTVTGKTGGKSVAASKYKSIVASKNEEISYLKKKLKRQERRIEAAAEAADRQMPRSIQASAMLQHTLAKGNVTIDSLLANGQKMSIAEFDQISTASRLNSVQSMAAKNEAIRLGVLEDGQVVSGRLQ